MPRIPTNDNSTTRIYENNKITSLFRHPRSNTEFVYHRTSRIPEFIEIIYSTSRVIHSLLAPIRIPTRPIHTYILLTTTGREFVILYRISIGENYILTVIKLPWIARSRFPLRDISGSHASCACIITRE